jgi:hypothetical protein
VSVEWRNRTLVLALGVPATQGAADRVSGVALRAQVLGVLVGPHVPAEGQQNTERAGVARVGALVAAHTEVIESLSFEEQQSSLRTPLGAPPCRLE